MSNDEKQEQPAFVKTPFVPMSKSMNRRPRTARFAKRGEHLRVRPDLRVRENAETWRNAEATPSASHRRLRIRQPADAPRLGGPGAGIPKPGPLDNRTKGQQVSPRMPSARGAT